ncbi:MAG: hypothetical protein K0Q73_8548 [Paenibacillus sp.]|nr:hypothetical protein [Paenibacillus sp.]
MPYVKKEDLKLMLKNAFGSGYWSAMEADHEVDSLHIKQDNDFEKFYEAFLKKDSKSHTT